MSVRRPTRRRVLGLVAAGAAALRMPAAFAEVPLTRWRGYALGAEASLTIRDPDLARAKQALRACVAEIERIEQVFSLYRKDSVLCALNTEGILADPPAELVDVLSFAAHMSLISEDAFDVTVQPLWNVYVHAQRDPRALFGELELARSRIGWRRLSITRDRLAFELPNMAATLNGIAQGYATDRIAKLLRLHGFSHVLVNLGEYGAYGERAAGAPWRIGVAWPDREGLAAVLSLSDRAIATSSPLATPFDKNGEHHHLFDPRTGRSARSWTSVSVVAPSAMRADALSTAIAVAPKAAAEAILGAGGGLEAILIDGERVFRIRA